MSLLVTEKQAVSLFLFPRADHSLASSLVWRTLLRPRRMLNTTLSLMLGDGALSTRPESEHYLYSPIMSLRHTIVIRRKGGLRVEDPLDD